jgi:UDP-N-acetylmuramoyl-tripeptide--D-alanyl-D-alanine ligase
VEAVARENGSVLSALPAVGTAVFPADDDYTPVWAALAGAGHVCALATPSADISLAGTEWVSGHWQVGVQTPAGPLAFPLHIAGRHNVRNALAAAACALAAGAPLEAIARAGELCARQGPLARFRRHAGRAHIHRGGRHLQRQP